MISKLVHKERSFLTKVGCRIFYTYGGQKALEH